jgi:hypothetical protein
MSEKEWIEDREEMEAILQEETVGYLALAAEGQPYVVPLNYAYADGRILFHCALSGKKLDWLATNSQACFAVGRQSGLVGDHGPGGACHLDSDSVICYGWARVVEDLEERRRVLEEFNRRYYPAAEPLSAERVAGCCAIELRVEEMTGRQERQRQRTCWRYHFS